MLESNIYLAMALLYIMGKPTIISTHTQRLNVFEVNDPCIIQNATSQNSDVPPRNINMISDISSLPNAADNSNEDHKVLSIMT